MTARKYLVFVTALAVALGALPALADESASPFDAETEAAWAAAAVPGEAHALLATQTGEWQTTSKMWMEPGGEPMTMTADSSAEMILGGRFLLEKVKGTVMGMPFDGIGLTGYDNTTHVVTSVWVDTQGTVMSIMTGVYEKIGEPMELFGSLTDPITGQEIKTRTVTTFGGDDAHTMDYFMTMGDMPEMKAMEMVYTRK